MKTVRLPDHDRREIDEAFHTLQANARTIPNLRMRCGLLGLILLICIGGEGAMIFGVVNDAIGPLPGEAPSAVPAIVSLSGLISVIAFYLYKRAHPESLPVRFVNRVVGYIALSFLLVMGLMLAKLFFENMSSDDAALAALFGQQAADSKPFLSRFFDLMTGPFALVFGSLTICNLFVAETALTRLRAALRELIDVRARVANSGRAMNELEEHERELAKLDVERQQTMRALEPSGAFAFAQELSSVAAEARSPIEQWITAQHLRKKEPESVLGAKNETDIDISKLKERVASLQLDAKVIYATFRSDEKGAK